MTEDLTEGDLVLTCVGDGVSSLLTMPVPGVTVDDLRRMTCVAQIEPGMPTKNLNPIRNHLDMMKGGRLSRRLHPARMIHILPNRPR